MKNIWKVFQFEKYDVLVSKVYEKHEDAFQLNFTVCVELGGECTVSMGYKDEKDLHSSFEKVDAEGAQTFAKYIFDSLGGKGIFNGSGPDEVEIVSRSTLKINH